MITPQERVFIDKLKSEGKSKEQIVIELGGFRAGAGRVSPRSEPRPQESALEKAKGFAVGGAKGITQTAVDTAKLVQGFGQRTQALLDPTRSLEEIQQKTGFQALKGKQAEGVAELLRAKSPSEKLGRNVAFGAELLVSGGAGLIKKGFQFGAKKVGQVAERAGEVVEDVREKALDVLPDTRGVGQQLSELKERVPRFFGRVKESTQEASERAVRLEQSTPAAQTAIKSGLNEQVINTVQQADQSFLVDVKKMVNLAEKKTNKKGTLGTVDRPELIAGNASGEQYKLIENNRKEVGSKIGEAVDKLSKTTTVNMENAIGNLDDVLRANGGSLVKNKWNFTGTFSKAETTKINELWEEIQKGVEGLSPRQVYDFDKLFSKLQREARFDGLNLQVDTPQGNMNLFRVFRDVFTNTLDEVVDPNIRELNREYRKLVTFQDDIEKSIIKGGKFETGKGIDPAQFAQTNLRRLDSDALSATDFREIVREMDTLSRELGYTGSNPEDLINFANELRRIYPDTIPKTGFAGGIRTGLSEIAGSILKAGEPDIADQQKALQELIDSLITQ